MWIVGLLLTLVATGSQDVGSVEGCEETSHRLPGLIRQLRDGPTPTRRESAAAYLGDLGRCAEGATPALLAAFQDPEGDVRLAAVQAVARIRPGPSAIPDLARVAQDSRCMEAGGLIIEAASAALVEVGKPSVPFLIELLLMRPCGGDTAWTSGGIAAAALGQLGRVALPEVLEASESGLRRQGAIEALGWMGPELATETLPTLKTAARDRSRTIRFTAAQALGRLSATAVDALPELEALVRDDDETVCASAIQALRQMGPAAAAAVSTLLLRLERERARPIGSNHRLSILMTLGAIGPGASCALPAIRSFLDHPDHVTRNAAKKAISEIEIGRAMCQG